VLFELLLSHPVHYEK